MGGLLQVNAVTLGGMITEPFKRTDYKRREIFESNIVVRRRNEVFDHFQIQVDGDDFDVDEMYVGQFVFIEGEINIYSHKGEPPISYIKVNRIDVMDRRHINEVFLVGEISRLGETRLTKGNKIVCNYYVGVKTSRLTYIPCISWNNHAEKVAKSENGDQIFLRGRIQNRLFHSTRGGKTTEFMKLEVTAFDEKIYLSEYAYRKDELTKDDVIRIFDEN